MTTGSIGKIINRRYKINGRIGSGGMGTVWSGTDISLRRPVAIKEVSVPRSCSAADAEQLRARYLREGRAAARLQHPGVVGVYDVISEDADPANPNSPDGGRVWIMMELLKAKDLSAVIREQGRLDPTHVAGIGLQLLDALDAAHRAGVLHRDVKPANVLLCDSNERAHRLGEQRVVLTDFGIASIVGDPSLTRTGQLLGSPAYVPPERLTGEHEIGPASDLWSLGCTLYAAVEGRAPFHNDDPFKVVTAVTRDPVPPPRHAGPLTPILLGLLEKDPRRRWSTEQVRSALAQVSDNKTTVLESRSAAVMPQGTIAVLDSHAAGTGTPRRRSRALITAAVVAIILILGVASFFAASQLFGNGKLTSKASDTHPKKANNYTSFTHPELGYRLRYPAAWQHQCLRQLSCNFGPQLSEEDGNAVVSVTAESSYAGNPQALNRSDNQRNRLRLLGYQVNENNPRTTLGDNEGALLDYHYRDTAGSAGTAEERSVVFRTRASGQRLYTLSIEGPATVVDKQLAAFQKIAGSFTIAGADLSSEHSSAHPGKTSQPPADLPHSYEPTNTASEPIEPEDPTPTVEKPTFSRSPQPSDEPSAKPSPPVVNPDN